jgi:hypothetical protein
MSERTLMRILAFAKTYPIMPRNAVAGRLRKNSVETRRMIKKKL